MIPTGRRVLSQGLRLGVQRLGWTISKYLLATTGPKGPGGIDGAIMGRGDHKQAVINTISVDSWEEGARACRRPAAKC